MKAAAVLLAVLAAASAAAAAEAATAPLERAEMSGLRAADGSGERLESVTAGRAVHLTAGVSGAGGSSGGFAYLVSVSDAAGATVAFGWDEGELRAGSGSDASVEWTPAAPGRYLVTAFLWEGLGSPVPLAPHAGISVEVLPGAGSGSGDVSLSRARAEGPGGEPVRSVAAGAAVSLSADVSNAGSAAHPYAVRFEARGPGAGLDEWRSGSLPAGSSSSPSVMWEPAGTGRYEVTVTAFESRGGAQPLAPPARIQLQVLAADTPPRAVPSNLRVTDASGADVARPAAGSPVRLSVDVAGGSAGEQEFEGTFRVTDAGADTVLSATASATAVPGRTVTAHVDWTPPAQGPYTAAVLTTIDGEAAWVGQAQINVGPPAPDAPPQAPAKAPAPTPSQTPGQTPAQTPSGATPAPAAPAPIALDRESYTWTDEVVITVTPPGFTDTPRTQTIGREGTQLTVSTESGKLKRYELTETGPTTASFRGSVLLTGSPYDADGDGSHDTNPRTSESGPDGGTLKAARGNTLTVSYGEHEATAPIRWHEGTAEWLGSTYAHGSEARIRVTDRDMGLDPKREDTVTVRATSGADPAGANVTLRETGKATGVFEGGVRITAAGGQGGLRAAPGDTLTATYVDRTRPGGSPDKVDVKATARAEGTAYALNMSNVRAVDRNGIPERLLSEGAETYIAADLRALGSGAVRYEYAVSVSGPGGYSRELREEDGTVAAGETEAPRAKWTAGPPGTYTFTATATSGSTDLAPPATAKIEVPPPRSAQPPPREEPPPAPAPVVALDRSEYSWTDIVRITVTAPGLNADSSSVETIGGAGPGEVRVGTGPTNALDGYALLETGPDTGVFEGTVRLAGSATDGVAFAAAPSTGGAGPDGGRLEATRGDTVTATVGPAGDGQASASAGVAWTTGSVSWAASNHTLPGSGTVRVEDRDMDLDPGAPDEVTVSVRSGTDGSGVDLVARETGPSTGVFEAAVEFVLSGESGDGRLLVSEGDAITADYVDNTPATGNPVDLRAESAVGACAGGAPC